MINEILAKDAFGRRVRVGRGSRAARWPAVVAVCAVCHAARAGWARAAHRLAAPRQGNPPWATRSPPESVISGRIGVLAFTQLFLTLLLVGANLIMRPEQERWVTVILSLPALLVTGLLYLLRGTRFAEAMLYVNLAGVSAVLALADPLSGTLSGGTWVLFQIWPPLTILALRRARAGVVGTLIPLAFLLLSALLQISGVLPVLLLAPPATLLRNLIYQALALLVISVALQWMDRREPPAPGVPIPAPEAVPLDLLQRDTRAARAASYETVHDRLTGLPNRTLFLDRLSQAIQRARRGAALPFAVLLLDLDRFTTINDSLGPLIGDELLIAVARRLEGGLRPGDSVARLGSDEFAVLVEGLPHREAAADVANRLQEALATPFSLHGQDVFLTASIGIAPGPAGYRRPEDVLRDGDAALHQAKRRGHAGHAVFEVAMYVQALTRLQMETDLRRAVGREEFVLYYQPIVALPTTQIIGFEALVRWRHPTRGILAPGDFLPLAEDTGLIEPLSRWVLREACRQIAAWQSRAAAPPLTISVNVAAALLAQPTLAAQIARTLEETGLASQQLKLEIVEGALLVDGAAAVLQQLKALGVQLSLDDFGTGYSSLSYLHRFPVDTIKIDRSFVSRLDSDPDHVEVISAIMTLARALGLETVAEGVETSEQYRRLQALGCDYAQGWLFAPALAPAEAAALLARGHAR